MPAPGVGELSTHIISRETTFGTLAGGPWLLHAAEAFTPTTKNVFNPRPGSRGAPDEVYDATGPLEISLTFRPESQAGILEQLIAYSMGTQATPVLYGTGTLGAAITTAPGSVSVALSGLPLNSIQAGTILLVDAGTAQGEVVIAGTGSSYTGLLATTFANNHSKGATIQIVGEYGTIAAAITSSGSAQTVTTTNTSGSILPGQTVYVDYGSATSYEAVVALAGSGGSTLKAVFSKNHSTNVKIAASSVAYQNVFTFGKLKVLPSFSLQRNRGTIDTVDFLGCSVDQVKFQLDSAKNLMSDFTILAQQFQLDGSPVTPTQGLLGPYKMEASATAWSINSVVVGTGSVSPDVLSATWSLNNQLGKNRRSAGSGRLVTDFPLGQRKLSGTMKLGFEDDSIQRLFFNGGLGGTPTVPGSVVTGVPMTFLIAASDIVDTVLSLPYFIQFYFPNCEIEAAEVPHVVSGALEQNVTFTPKQSVPGAGDSLTVTVCNANSTAY